MSDGEPIYLWDAGPDSGTSGSRKGAFEAAAPYLGGEDEVTVLEAEVDLMPLGGASSEHRRTGKAWRGTLEGGEPSWAQVADRAAAELAGEEPPAEDPHGRE